MNTKNKKTLDLCNEAISVLKKSIDEMEEKSEKGIMLNQMKNCENQLREMIYQISNNQLPSKDRRLFGMAHMIGDSWPLDSSLGSILIEAEQMYRSL